MILIIVIYKYIWIYDYRFMVLYLWIYIYIWNNYISTPNYIFILVYNNSYFINKS